MTAPQLAPGTIVAQKYQIGACFGYAGSSATYQAATSDGREVVLKIFDPAIRQRGDIMAAIEQTYAATNALPQDVAAPLLDAGYDPGTGAPFSVGERIPFPSLSQLAGQRPLTPDEVVQVLGVLSHLLDQAHAGQLFHHALKPTNVFIGFAQGQGVRVTDFGAGLSRAAVPTQEGYALAAPWLAPEQVQGNAPAGAAADVFSVGLVVFFALTGRSYWRSCQGAPDLQGWQQELTGPRTPPSARALQLGVMFNSNFDGVLGCALSADPGQRYRSVGELAQAFEALVGAQQPESQATMAFPAGAFGLNLGGGGAYPPPPKPSGGYQPAPGPAAGGQGQYAAAPGNATLNSPYAPQQAQQPQPQPGGGYGGQPPQPDPYGGQQGQPPAQAQAAGYVSTQNPGAAQLGETAAGRVIDPVAFQRRASPNRLVPVLVGGVALVLLSGAAAAWVLMSRRHPDGAQAAASASAAAEATTASAAPAADTASAAPADSASAAPADSASAAPADSGSAAPADSAAAAGDSTLACDPDCDEIRVDDQPIELGKPVTLTPGKHVIVASKSGYVTIKETLKVKAGDKVDKTYKLVAKPAAAAGAAPAGPTKPCGKFLKRGAGCK
jgi:eukaryotic-like serine/threonine-protein kinase